jgi:hypothetical protein
MVTDAYNNGCNNKKTEHPYKQQTFMYPVCTCNSYGLSDWNVDSISECYTMLNSEKIFHFVFKPSKSVAIYFTYEDSHRTSQRT